MCFIKGAFVGEKNSDIYPLQH